MIDSIENLDHLLIVHAKELFTMCDVENKGLIDRKDFQRLSDIFYESTEVELNELFDSLDPMGNGVLNLDDMTLGLKKSLENDSMVLKNKYNFFKIDLFIFLINPDRSKSQKII